LQFLGPGKVVASAKHFIGDGATEFGIDGGDTVLEQEELIAHQGLPYKAAIQAGVQVMLVTKGMVNGEYVHGSHALLTDLLKDQWGFDGFLYSDRFGYTNLNGCAVDNCPTAINAGIDAFMIPFWWNGVAMITNTATQVRDGGGSYASSGATGCCASSQTADNRHLPAAAWARRGRPQAAWAASSTGTLRRRPCASR